MGCILCGRPDANTVRMNVEFADGRSALLDVELCGDCRGYLDAHGKRLVAVVDETAIVDWRER